MTECTQESFEFPACKRRVLEDPRRKASVNHNDLSLLRQRLYALALGYEDLNDHGHLRKDLAIQTAVDRDRLLASGHPYQTLFFTAAARLSPDWINAL